MKWASKTLCYWRTDGLTDRQTDIAGYQVLYTRDQNEIETAKIEYKLWESKKQKKKFKRRKGRLRPSEGECLTQRENEVITSAWLQHFSSFNYQGTRFYPSVCLHVIGPSAQCLLDFLPFSFSGFFDVRKFVLSVVHMLVRLSVCCLDICLYVYLL